MTSIICPKCKSHISEWDVNCLNCGITITQELREQLSKEQQKQRLKDNLTDIPPQVMAFMPKSVGLSFVKFRSVSILTDIEIANFVFIYYAALFQRNIQFQFNFNGQKSN